MVIQTEIRKLRAACKDDVNAVLTEHVGKIATKMGSAYPRALQVTPTALNVIEDTSLGYKPFTQVLSALGMTACRCDGADDRCSIIP
jgi:hypothetical protein